MSEPHKGWVALVVPAELRAAAARRVSEVLEVEVGEEYFPVPLRGLGGREATHYLASPRARQSVITRLDREAADWPGCAYILLRHDDLPPDWRVSLPIWLRSLGLEVYEEET